MKGITFIEIDGELCFGEKNYELKVRTYGNNNEQKIRKECENECEDIPNVMVKVGVTE
jgi:hypothetical protein